MRNIRQPSPEEEKWRNQMQRMQIDDIMKDPNKSWLQKMKEIEKIKLMDKLIKY